MGSIDLQVIEGLRQLEGHGAPGLLRQLVALFLDPLDGKVDDIAAAANDPKKLEREAHALRGSSAQLGAVELARACTALEEGAVAGRTATKEQIDELRAAAARARKELEELPR